MWIAPWITNLHMQIRHRSCLCDVFAFWCHPDGVSMTTAIMFIWRKQNKGRKWRECKYKYLYGLKFQDNNALFISQNKCHRPTNVGWMWSCEEHLPTNEIGTALQLHISVTSDLWMKMFTTQLFVGTATLWFMKSLSGRSALACVYCIQTIRLFHVLYLCPWSLLQLLQSVLNFVWWVSIPSVWSSILKGHASSSLAGSCDLRTRPRMGIEIIFYVRSSIMRFFRKIQKLSENPSNHACFECIFLWCRHFLMCV